VVFCVHNPLDRDLLLRITPLGSRRKRRPALSRQLVARSSITPDRCNVKPKDGVIDSRSASYRVQMACLGCVRKLSRSCVSGLLVVPYQGEKNQLVKLPAVCSSDHAEAAIAKSNFNKCTSDTKSQREQRRPGAWRKHAKDSEVGNCRRLIGPFICPKSTTALTPTTTVSPPTVTIAHRHYGGD
jgi:hypothetical protein